ncbi:PrpF protein [Xylophilus rhododendri]|uniref:PrpF protein n=1 Tax=Xylophilus rhododendri TaxID=2697032 RepID=A0A857JBA5_9BURK|nr:PrpF domain-containing protein [Xylophilus rhododendri]QHJ01301.1 PrpF protein [Xylophilus rhododendri]
MQTETDHEQIALPCTLMRGGTSKGLYFSAADLPPPGPRRDAMLKAALGSQDLLQIDGLGGSRLVTAKLAIVAPSQRPDADVDYTYGIVPPGRGLVVYTSNCGNISAGVGPFAIDSGMVAAQGPVTQVRIFNTNTGKLLIAHVPVQHGRVKVSGDFAIPGVPGTGAEIFMDYRATTGAKTGKVMPTGHAIDTIALEDGRRIEASIGDVANPCVFVRAADVGCTGPALPLPVAIDADETLIATLKELRGKAAALIGLASDWRAAETESPALPLVVLVAPPRDYTDSQGRPVAAAEMDLQARFIFYNKCHESMAGTGSMCIAAMSCIPGTLVREAAAGARPGSLRIGHPLGAMTVVCEAEAGAAPQAASFKRLGFGRTARRLMQGIAYLPRDAVETEAAMAA